MLVIGSGAPRLDPAPAHVVAQRSGHLAQRPPLSQRGHLVVLAHGPTVDGVLKSFQGGFERREPPLQCLRYAVWSRRHRPTGRGAIGVRARSGPGRSCPAHDAAEPQSLDPSLTSFGRPTRQVEEADLRCGPDRGRRARRITSPGLQQAYSSGNTTARASLARVSARRRSRARHATSRPHGLPHRSAKWGSHGGADLSWGYLWPSAQPRERRKGNGR
jgi:hypothetical protein